MATPTDRSPLPKDPENRANVFSDAPPKPDRAAPGAKTTTGPEGHRSNNGKEEEMTYSDTPDHSTDKLKNRAQHEYQDAKERLHDSSARLRQNASSNLMNAVTSELERRKSGMGDELRTIAKSLRHASEEQESEGVTAPAGLISKGADLIEDLSEELENRSVDDMGRAVSDYARANPAIFVGGCLIAGLALGRVLTASTKNVRSDREPQSTYGASPYAAPVPAPMSTSTPKPPAPATPAPTTATPASSTPASAGMGATPSVRTAGVTEPSPVKPATSATPGYVSPKKETDNGKL
ncbi:hypothetical protein [Falsirhodobacter deserti]|uniref:hypothetical protein n=1 Tax=Falsirhodobacter deserti TaxID=1365611 RepID=UPI000FE3293D|nr:hypothetical protein [Falsirhodobacter deserti]